MTVLSITRLVSAFQRKLTILQDNEPDATYYYLVTVLTGWRNSAGTTSKVALYILGTRASTKIHVMADAEKSVMESGAENWFLLATREPLGDLRSLSIWHSCGGLFPNWLVQCNSFT